jgi:hypothetical protein
MTSNPPCDIQSLRDEYEAKLSSNAAEIAELKIMLQQVLHTLQHIGVQQESSNAGSADQIEPTPTANTNDMDVSHTIIEEIKTPKRSGTESPTHEESSRTKRPDHKSSPAKQLDFCRDG